MQFPPPHRTQDAVFFPRSQERLCPAWPLESPQAITWPSARSAAKAESVAASWRNEEGRAQETTWTIPLTDSLFVIFSGKARCCPPHVPTMFWAGLWWQPASLRRVDAGQICSLRLRLNSRAVHGSRKELASVRTAPSDNTAIISWILGLRADSGAARSCQLGAARVVR